MGKGGLSKRGEGLENGLKQIILRNLTLPAPIPDEEKKFT